MLNLAYESTKQKKAAKPAAKPKAPPKGPKLPGFLEQKSLNRSTAAETGISSESPLLKAFRQTLSPSPAAPKTVPTEDQKFKSFQQSIGVKNPPRRPTTTELRRGKPGTVEYVMAQLDKDKRLKISPEDRETVANVLRFRAMRPMGDGQYDPEIRVNAFDPAGIEGRVRNEDVIDVLSLLRNKKSLLTAELDGHRAQREALAAQVAAQRANPGPALVPSDGRGQRVNIDEKGQITPYDPYDETYAGKLLKNLDQNEQALMKTPVGKAIGEGAVWMDRFSPTTLALKPLELGAEYFAKPLAQGLKPFREALANSGSQGLAALAPMVDEPFLKNLTKMREEMVRQSPVKLLTQIPQTVLKAEQMIDPDPRISGEHRLWDGLEVAMNVFGAEMVTGAMKAGRGLSLLAEAENVLNGGATIPESLARLVEHETEIPGVLGKLEKVGAEAPKQSTQVLQETPNVPAVENRVLPENVLPEVKAEPVAAKADPAIGAEAKTQQMDGGTAMMDPNDIGVHDGIQFKRKTDNKDRVTARFKNIKNFDVDQAGEITVWRRADGTMYVAHGHHRLELAKRAERFVKKGPNGELVDVPRQIKVRFLNEAGDANGANPWDLNAVRLHAAWENLQNGDGSALDGLMVLKEMGKTPDDFSEMGISTGKALSRDIDGLMKLNDDAIRFVLNDQIAESAAAGVGDSGILPKYQAKAIARLIEEGGQQSYEDAKSAARVFGNNAKRNEGRIKSDQGSLGGMEDWAEVVDTVSEETRLEAKVKREMLDEFTSLKKGLSLETLPNEIIDEKGRKTALAAMGDTRGRLKWAADKAFENWEPLQEMRYELALKVKNGEITETQAARELKRYLFDEISKKPPVSDYVIGRRLAKDEGNVSNVVGDGDKLLPKQSEEVVPEKPADGALFDDPEPPAKPAKVEAAKESPLDETVKGASDLSERDQAAIKSLGPVKVRSREDFVQGVKEHFGLSDEEVAAGMAVQDARAKGWAADTGNKAEDWYAAHWEAVTSSPGKSESAFQGNKGFIHFKEDGKAILAAMKNPDVSTFIHEVGHLFRRQLPEEATKFLESYYKLENGKWTVDAEEDFARQFERWAYDGRVSHKKLEGVFVKLRDWFRNVYSSLSGSPIEKQLNPRLRDIFERLTNEKGFYADYDPTLGVKASATRKGGTSIVFDNKQWELSAQEHSDFTALRAKQKTDFQRLKAQMDVAETDDPLMGRMIASDLKELEKAHKAALNEYLERTEAFQKQVDALMSKDLDGRAPGFRLDDGGEIDPPDKELLFQRQFDPESKAEILGWIKQVLAENGGDGMGAVKYFKAQGLMESEAVSLVLEAGGRIKAGLGLETKTMALDLFDEPSDQGTLFQKAISKENEDGSLKTSLQIQTEKHVSSNLTAANQADILRAKFKNVHDSIIRGRLEDSLEAIKINGARGLGAEAYNYHAGNVAAMQSILDYRTKNPWRERPEVPKWARGHKLFDEPSDQGTLFQSAKAKQDENGFYLKSARIVDQKMGGAMAPHEMENMLRNNGVTQDELDWTGLGDLISGAKGRKLTKAEVEKWIDDNSVRIEIGSTDDYVNLKRQRERVNESLRKVRSDIRKSEKHPEVIKYKETFDQIIKTSEGSFAQKLTELVQEAENGKWGPEVEDYLELKNELRYQERLQEQLRDANPEGRFGSYTVGGKIPKNYREVLLKGKLHDLEILDGRVYDVKGKPFAVEFDSDAGKFTLVNELNGEIVLTGKQKIYDYLRENLDSSETRKGVKPGPDQHFDAQTIVHVRASDRKINGRKSYFLEEVQSDRHQEARKNGSDPGAPFAKNWPEVAMRQSLRTAVEEGYDSLSWTEGNIHARRYSQLIVEKVGKIQVDEESLVYHGRPNVRQRVIKILDHENNNVYSAATTPEYTTELLGKNLADRIWSNSEAHTITDFDGAIGGEGFRQFYDKAIPSYMKKYVKKWGAEVKPTTMKVNGEDVKVWEVEITPEMRRSVMDEGQTLFQAGDEVLPELANAGYDKPLTIQEEREIAGKAAMLKAKIDAAFAFFGSPTDQIRAVGRAGSPNREAAVQIADDLEKISNNTLKWEYRLSKDIDDTAAAGHGRVNIAGKDIAPNWKEIDAELEDMARKIFRGEVDKIEGKTAKAVYQKWVKINGGLLGSAEAQDVVIDVPVYKIARPERMAEEWPGVSEVEHQAMTSAEFWKNQDIRWYGEDDNGSSMTLSGRVVSIERDGIWVKANTKAKKEFLGIGRKVSRFSQVAPENYFPRVLKQSVIDELQDQAGPAWDWVQERLAAMVTDGDEDLAARLKDASESVVRKAKAEQQWRIDRAVQEFLHPSDMGNAITAGPARVEWERLPMAYPEEFYDFDFRKIAKRHINGVVSRVQEAAIWGHDGSELNRLLSRLGRDAGPVLEKIHMALGKSEQRFKFEKAVRTAISIEGAWQVVSKLTALTSSIKQIPQLGSTIGVLGFKNGLKAMRLGAIWDSSVRAEIAQIIRSGVTGESLSYLQMEDMSDAARKLSNAAVTATGLKPVDNALRVLSAAAGKDAATEAVKKLRVVDGVIQRYKDLKIVGKLREKGVNPKLLPPALRDPNYSLLRDWFHYTDEDIAQMVQTGKMTPTQRDMAYQGGAKTQVRTRASDIPSLMQRNPLMRVMTRFRTFQYGQAKILTYAMNEATRGNLAPLTRMTLGYATLGYLSDKAVREVKAWMENKAPKKDYDTIQANLTWGMINGGLGGIFLEPLNSGENKIMDEDADPGDKAKALAGGVRNLVVPPILSDMANVAGGVAAMDDYNTKNPLIGLDDFLRGSVPLYARLAKRGEPDEAEIKRLRSEVKKELQKQGFSNSYIESFLESRYQLPAPRWANDKYKSWQKDLRQGIQLGGPGEVITSKGQMLDRMVDRPDPYDRPKKK